MSQSGINSLIKKGESKQNQFQHKSPCTCPSQQYVIRTRKQVRPDDQSGYQRLIRASSLGIHSDRWNAPLLIKKCMKNLKMLFGTECDSHTHTDLHAHIHS